MEGEAALDEKPASTADRANQLFAAIAGRSGNGELVAAVRSLGSRLSMVRCREASLISNVDEELRLMEQLHCSNDFAGLRRALHSYHRRRQRIADRLVIAMQPS